MLLRALDPLAAIRDDSDMTEFFDDEVSENPIGFRTEARDVLEQLRSLFNAILAVLGTRRPVELQRKLKLDLTLSWQIFKVAGESTALSAGASMPSRARVEKFANAALASGVDGDQIARLLAAYERFEGVVQRHAGDRTSFISLVTSASGITEEWLTADLQHRRNMYRGMSHVMGVQARTRFLCTVLAGGPKPAGTKCLLIDGYVGLRTLREIPKIRVHGTRIERGPESTDDPHRWQRLSDGISGEGSVLTEFCSQPLPRIHVKFGELIDERWQETFVVRPEMGNLGTMTLVFADLLGGADLNLPTELVQQQTIPSELLIHDLLVPAALIEGEPKLEVYTGDDRPANRSPDQLPILGNHRLERLGRGTDVLATSEVPRYDEMMGSLMRRAGLNGADFESWRVRLEFPIHQSKTRVTWRQRV